MKRIVLIDDDRDDAEIFGEALEEVRPALQFQHYESAQDALSSLQSFPEELPDLIFLDINMPVMSGWELLTSLKGHRRLSVIPVLMYSTSSQAREKRIAEDLGAAGFFTKPNDFKDLKKLLENVLSTRL